jgi:PAS domain S-box-containing protein
MCYCICVEVAMSSPESNEAIKVLLVDDDQDSYVLTRHQLSKIPGGNFEVEWAPSYEAGLEAIKRGEHDVYLLDYRLGAKTGLDLLQEALATGCKAPIIMLTSENPLVDAEAMKLGAADFLSKDKLDSALLERSIRYSVKHFNTLRALRESEARLASFMHYVPCAVFIKNLQGRYVFVNETCEKVFRRKLDQWVGRTDEDLWSKSLANKFKQIDQQIIKEKKAVETTESVSHEDGAQHWLTTRFPILNEHGEPSMIGGAAINITESRRLEREIQTVSEREQRRIGQDLHDGLGQYLTGIACMVKVLGAKLAEKELPEAADAQRITSMVNETIQQTRDLARGLCPVELETNGLQAALQELAARVTKLFSVSCEFKAPTVVQMYDNAAAVHLYRIAQEAINNAIKHGQATRIQIGLTSANGQIILTVKDNGAGLPSGGQKSHGMGLRVMNYRAAMIGANVHIENSPEGGALVRCAVQNNRPAPPSKKPVKIKPAVKQSAKDAEPALSA